MRAAGACEGGWWRACERMREGSCELDLMFEVMAVRRVNEV